jgi:predicted membrane protein
MNSAQVWRAASFLLLICSLRTYGQNSDHKPVTIITFDVPGAVNGTFPAGLNNDGVVTGLYADNIGSGFHGFLRDADGIITTFDVPGAVVQTVPSAINSEGVVAGNYCDATNCHGFLRAPDGGITTFDVPGAVNGTFPVGLNDEGVVTGSYGDNVGAGLHSFVRSTNGVFTKFDPGMITNLPGIINDAGTIIGYYFDVSPQVRSFVRDHKGTVTIFDAPNVCKTSNGTFATGINPARLIVGVFYDAGCAHFHGFLRSPEGAFSRFDIPGADDTSLSAINPAGTTTGSYFAGKNILGFVRSRKGAVTTFLPPGATSVGPTAINAEGEVTGNYSDANSRVHGFLMKPRDE